MSDSRYKKDSLVQAWIDRRYLATIINWLHKKGESPRSLSEILKMAVENLTQAATSGEYKVEFVELTEDAHTIIDSCLRVNLNRGGRGLKNLRQNTMIDKMRMARIDTVDGRSKEILETETNIDPIQLLVDSGLAQDREEAEKMIKEHDPPTDKN